MSKRSKTEIAIENYEIACRNLVRFFEARQDLTCDEYDKEFYHYWFNNESYHFTLDDIIHDLRTKQPKGNIIEWHNGAHDNIFEINYKSWCMGLRHEQLNR